MTLIRWNPLRDATAWNPSDISTEFGRMQHDIDRMFDRFMQGGTTDDGSTSTWLPEVDIVEHDDKYEVNVELPGVNKNDVKITVQNDALTIQGRSRETELEVVGSRGQSPELVVPPAS